jgi:hypothetical protein
MRRCKAIFRPQAKHNIFSMQTPSRDTSRLIFPLPEQAIHLAFPQDYIIRLANDIPTLFPLMGRSKIYVAFAPFSFIIIDIS